MPPVAQLHKVALIRPHSQDYVEADENTVLRGRLGIMCIAIVSVLCNTVDAGYRYINRPTGVCTMVHIGVKSYHFHFHFGKVIASSTCDTHSLRITLQICSTFALEWTDSRQEWNGALN